MSINITEYCLENITDYLGFEDLCNELMLRLGFRSLEPLGGFKDRGRDAVHRDTATKQVTIFAYSVREDWRAKLEEDSKNISEHGHECQKLVFLSTSRISASERDEAIEAVRQQYGWALELYGLKRLRLLIDGTHPEVKDHHPGIFPPELRPLRRHRAASPLDVAISCASGSTYFAHWLCHKLTTLGYRARFFVEDLGSSEPSRQTAESIADGIPIVGLVLSEEYLSINSAQQIRVLANNQARMLDQFNFIEFHLMDPQPQIGASSNATLIDISSDWAKVLRRVIDLLPDSQLANSRILSRVLLGPQQEPEVREEIEILDSNFFAISDLPTHLALYSPRKAPSRAEVQMLKQQWACRIIDDGKVLSFFSPPEQLRQLFNQPERVVLGETVFQIPKHHLLKELLRRWLEQELVSKGFEFSKATATGTWLGRGKPRLHLPFDSQNKGRFSFELPEGGKTWLNFCGERTRYSAGKREKFRFFITPHFDPVRITLSRQANEQELEWFVLVHIGILVTDNDGRPLPKSQRNSRRKQVSRSWWNDHWRKRTIAIGRFLASGRDAITRVTVFNEDLSMEAFPTQIRSPLSISDAKALGS